MSAIPYLSASEITKTVAISALMTDMQKRFAADFRSHLVIPDRSLIKRDNPFAVFGTMCVYSSIDDVFVAKVAAYAGSARNVSDRGVSALVLAFSGSDGQLLAVIDGSEFTVLKCAAISALVTSYCTSPDCTTLAVIGSGAVARSQIAGILSMRPIRELRLFSRSPDNLERFIERISSLVPAVCKVVICRSVVEVIEYSDIISTCTASTLPLFSNREFDYDVHFNCMGAHTETSREVPPDLLSAATLIVEDIRTAVLEAGPVHKDALEVDRLHVVPRARLEKGVSIFSSTGYAMLDLIAALFLLDRFGLMPGR